MLPSKIYTFTIPAGGMYPLLVQGTYFKVISATAGFSVTGDTFGTLGAILSGQGLRDEPFNQLQFTDTSGSPNALRVLVADAAFIDDRITGEVSVIDGEKARTLAGGMFAAGPDQAAVAAQFSVCQLWNPAGTGKNVIVNQLEAYSGGVAATLRTRWDTAARATNVTATRAFNKLQSGNIGGAQVRTEAIVASSADWFRQTVVGAGAGFLWRIAGAIVIPPGRGLNIESNQANAALTANFEWFEEAV